MEQTPHYFLWQTSYELGIAQIDQQHKHFVEILNGIYDAFQQMLPKEKVNPVIDDLMAYANYHFETEEKYLRETNYPGLEEHHAIHQQLHTDLLEYISKYQQGSAADLLNLLDFLEDWLIHHLATEDHDYKDYLHEHGIK